MVRRELLVRGGRLRRRPALDVAARTDLGWGDRLAILRGHVLDHVPVLVLLDNFEDNLAPGGRLYGRGSGAGRAAGRLGE